jgi:hypothetical protein
MLCMGMHSVRLRLSLSALRQQPQTMHSQPEARNEKHEKPEARNEKQEKAGG